MNARRAEKLDGWEVIPVKKFPRLQELDAMTYLGSFAWTQPHKKRKWVKSAFVYNIGGGMVTPSDIARDYIAVKFEGERMKCNSKQYKKHIRNRIHQPLYAEVVSGMKASYLDLKSAYWQILMLGGWDVDYSRGNFLSVRSHVYDFPCPHLKLARNTLVSMGLPSQGSVWHPEKGLVRLRGGGSTINLILYGFAMDVLHAIAREMIDRAGAVYVNTDGYIIPDYLVKEAFTVADEWGVTLTPRHQGYATIRGAGDYDIANHRSSRPRHIAHPHEYIIADKINWLKTRFIFFNDRIDLSWNPMKERLGLTE